MFQLGSAVPDATLFDDEGNVVATHFAGPRWKSNSGSIVLGAAVQPTVTVDTNAIPWVRLRAVTTEGPGIFADTTFIQRVNTVGGKAPSADGAFVGQVARVPYTADYFFYRKTNKLTPSEHPVEASVSTGKLFSVITIPYKRNELSYFLR